MRTLKLSIYLLLLPYLALSQKNQQQFNIEFLLKGLMFPPLIANTFEPRVGFVFQAEDSDLRLDIGNSIDLLAFHGLLPANHKLAFGVDFFTWTALRQDENFHFPVDAVDYLFGMNLSHSMSIDENNDIDTRLRWSHISAHLVDGRYDKEKMEWRDGFLPRVYSREFFELIAAYRYKNFVRPYIGFTYVYHIDPGDLGKMIYQAGIEVTLPHSESTWLHPYIAYDMRLLEIEEYSSVLSFQGGVKIGKWYGRGINLFLAYYTGKSYHGEYYDLKESYWGPGINIDF